jgi:NADH-quinone oxidoreductase subunit J
MMISFLILAGLAVLTAILTIASKNPVKSAVALITNFFVLAGLYLSMNAQFLAVSQVIVYAGAIMVLIIFVIMLLNMGDESEMVKKIMKKPILGYSIALIFAIGIIASITASASAMKSLPAPTDYSGSAAELGVLLYNDYIVAVIGAGILLTVAILGAMKLAKRTPIEE